MDSSAWLEYIANGPNAEAFTPAIRSNGEVIVPTIVLYEVYKRLVAQIEEQAAMEAIAPMLNGIVVGLDEGLALSAAVLSAEHKLPMADSIVLATARRYGAVLWTLDADFEGMEGVEYRRYIP